VSLRFVDAADEVDARHTARVTPVVGVGADHNKGALLRGIGEALRFPAHFRDDNLDSFYDCLTDASGTVVLLNAASWWQADPVLMGRVCQCFLDVKDACTLVCVSAKS
jgi:Barstar (barnase inhibitor)